MVCGPACGPMVAASLLSRPLSGIQIGIYSTVKSGSSSCPAAPTPICPVSSARRRTEELSPSIRAFCISFATTAAPYVLSLSSIPNDERLWLKVLLVTCDSMSCFASSFMFFLARFASPDAIPALLAASDRSSGVFRAFSASGVIRFFSLATSPPSSRFQGREVR